MGWQLLAVGWAAPAYPGDLPSFSGKWFPSSAPCVRILSVPVLSGQWLVTELAHLKLLLLLGLTGSLSDSLAWVKILLLQAPIIL